MSSVIEELEGMSTDELMQRCIKEIRRGNEFQKDKKNAAARVRRRDKNIAEAEKTIAELRAQVEKLQKEAPGSRERVQQSLREYVDMCVSQGENVACPVCDTKIVAYNVNLGPVARFLFDIDNAPATSEGWVHRDSIKTKHQWGSLKYWGLIERARTGGMWRITTKGRQFMAGELRVQQHVTVRRDVVQNFHGLMVGIEDLVKPRPRPKRGITGAISIAA